MFGGDPSINNIPLVQPGASFWSVVRGTAPRKFGNHTGKLWPTRPTVQWVGPKMGDHLGPVVPGIPVSPYPSPGAESSRTIPGDILGLPGLHWGGAQKTCEFRN